MSNIVFHDRAGGGWYCTKCSQYIHHDLVYAHTCTLLSPKKLSEEARKLVSIIRSNETTPESLQAKKHVTNSEDLTYNGTGGVKPAESRCYCPECKGKIYKATEPLDKGVKKKLTPVGNSSWLKEIEGIIKDLVHSYEHVATAGQVKRPENFTSPQGALSAIQAATLRAIGEDEPFKQGRFIDKVVRNQLRAEIRGKLT